MLFFFFFVSSVSLIGYTLLIELNHFFLEHSEPFSSVGLSHLNFCSVCPLLGFQQCLFHVCFISIMEKYLYFSSTSVSSACKCFIYFCCLISFLSTCSSVLHFHKGDCIFLSFFFLIHGNIFLFTTWQCFVIYVLCG